MKYLEIKEQNYFDVSIFLNLFSKYSGNSSINLYLDIAIFLVFINVVLHTNPLVSGHNTIPYSFKSLDNLSIYLLL